MELFGSPQHEGATFPETLQQPPSEAPLEPPPQGSPAEEPDKAAGVDCEGGDPNVPDLRVEKVAVVPLENGDLLEVSEGDQAALAKALSDEAVIPSCAPPKKLTKGAIQKRLWRICQPKANGKFKIPKAMVDDYKDESTRPTVVALFEKSGYQRDCFGLVSSLGYQKGYQLCLGHQNVCFIRVMFND